MKILVTGGYGFIGSHIAERFYKEGHRVTILDNLSKGSKDRVHFKHKSIRADVEDEVCENYFQSQGFDVVVHCAAQTSVPVSVDHPVQDAESNIVGLVNMLHLSSKYRIKKFIFFSSAAVFGETDQLPINEHHTMNPTSPYGMSKMLGELYCEKWNALHGLSTLVFRLSNVYGPGQSRSHESGVIAKFLEASIHNEGIEVYGDGEQTRDYIHVGDVVEAVYRATISQLSGVYHLSSNTQTTLNEVIEEIKHIQPFAGVKYKESKVGDIRHSRLDNKELKKQIDWAPKYTLKEGILHTWKEEYEVANQEEKTPPLEQLRAVTKKSTPGLRFLENLVLFAIFFAAIWLIPSNLVPVDMWLVYILFAGLLFGKYQAMVASALAVAVISFGQIQNGREFTSLIADNSLIVTFTLYLVIGFLVGYIVDRRKIELAFAEEEKTIAEGKLEFMSGIYQDTREIKDELQNQILYTEDSIGKVYRAVKELDYLEPEDIFSNAIDTLETLLHHNRFGIYSVSPDGNYLRLVARSTLTGFTLPHSQRVENTLYQKVMEQQGVVFNKTLQPETPIFTAPILIGNNVVGIVAGYDVPFERLSLYYKNTIDITMRLISSALIRAYQHVDEVQLERYLPDTHVLRLAYYEKIVASKEKALHTHQLPYIRLRLPKELQPEQLRSIEPLLRSNDYLGQTKDGGYECLLSNITDSQVGIVQKRLQHYGITAMPLVKEV